MQVMGVEFPDGKKTIELTVDEDCPYHYRGDGFITASRAMRSAISRWPAAIADGSVMAVWWWCCAFKYVWRCMVKGRTLEDIDKAADCLHKLRKEMEPCLKSQMKADRIEDGKTDEA